MIPEQSFNRWVRISCMQPPFTPTGEGGNDGRVRDVRGVVITDCAGSESRADVVAAALNMAFGNGLLSGPEQPATSHLRAIVGFWDTLDAVGPEQPIEKYKARMDSLIDAAREVIAP